MLFLLIVVLILLAKNNFEPAKMMEDVRRMAKSLRKGARGVEKTVRHAVRDAKRNAAETPKAEPEQKDAVKMAQEKILTPEEEKENKALLNDMELNARTVAMMVNVPTLQFPEDDPKYDSSRKYGYAH